MKINEYLRITEAAQFLGVSNLTLRNWGKQNKIPTYRSPTSGYRLYKKEDLEKILEDLKPKVEISHAIGGITLIPNKLKE